ncbi:MAG: hypothetical protein P9M12_06840 [Candidatus Aceula lacicola]|nr:hypothetical protein [Candidatus Aceula lacicola]
MKEKKRNKTKGQATLEFAFCFLVLLLFFYSVVKAMQWIGITLVKPSKEHRQMYAEGMSNSPNYNPLNQLRGVDETLPKLDLVFNGDILD